MHDLKTELKEKEAFLLDMDGVIYIEDDPIEGSLEAVRNLRQNGRKLAFLTNNSTKTREEYKEKLSDLGLETDKSKIMTSACATALRLSELEENKTCFVLGEDGLKKELKDAGFELVSRKNAEKASFVVAGMDHGLTYEKIWGGLTAILSGAEFIATNPDSTYCTKDGLAPGAAASIGALAAAAEEEPSEIIGKPSTYMLEALLEVLDVTPERTAIIGDRIDTDIRAGKKLGLTTILVLTGVNSKKEVEEVKGTKKEPDFVYQSFEKLANEVI